MEKGAEIDVQNDEGETALHITSWFDHLEVMKLLIHKEANINSKNHCGETPFDITKKRSNKKLLELLENFQKKDI